jgi:hypothetical protein
LILVIELIVGDGNGGIDLIPIRYSSGFRELNDVEDASADHVILFKLLGVRLLPRKFMVIGFFKGVFNATSL